MVEYCHQRRQNSLQSQQCTGWSIKTATLNCFRALTFKLVTVGAISIGFANSKLGNTAEYPALLAKKKIQILFVTRKMRHGVGRSNFEILSVNMKLFQFHDSTET